MGTPFDDARLRERLEVLDGSRTGDRARAAVRFDDLAPLLQLPAKLKAAKAAGGNPTKAEFDALVDDVNALYLRLKAVMEIVQRAKL